MTRRNPPLPQSAVEEASAWAVRLSGGDMSEMDYLALETWLALAPEHPLALAEAEALWAALDDDRAALDAALTRAAAGASVAVASPRTSYRSQRRHWLWGMGAMAAAAAIAVVLFMPALGDRSTVYITAPGEQRIVELADGSTIAMNGASRLSVRLSGKERLVEMGPAEAAFDVAHDTQRPFRVSVGESRIEVLGTAFDVRRDERSTRVTVSRGVVRVSDLADSARNVRLTEGQTVTRADANDVLEVTAGPAGMAGWRTGRLVYNDRPLSEVAADLSRAWPTPVRTVGSVSDVRFTGVLILDDQASTLRRLETFLPVSATRRDGVVELRPR